MSDCCDLGREGVILWGFLGGKEGTKSAGTLDRPRGEALILSTRHTHIRKPQRWAGEVTWSLPGDLCKTG